LAVDKMTTEKEALNDSLTFMLIPNLMQTKMSGNVMLYKSLEIISDGCHACGQ